MKGPLDAHMLGVCLLITPRQILMLERFLPKCEPLPHEKSAYAEFKEAIDYEAAIKRKKYL